MTDTPGTFARPYVHNDPNKWEYILDKCCAHRPWFDDAVWENEETRRGAASKYLADTWVSGKLWEVWRGADLVGILLLTDITHSDAKCHFVFFDHKLSDKQSLCLSVMQWAFEHLDLHCLRLEIPTYARILIKFARRKLGFRYEAEGRAFSWPADATPLTERDAMLGARRHHATKYKGEWHDVLLLSITREEFDGFVRSIPITRGAETAGV
jgi:RimJ/RimL family protein N-acetyltransferase